ncbi:unnamed protein product [Caenorhabditis auriculariae]|uniref:Alpha-mannosidase n=1 Tax=Caenorhabditis auriculariae TaxID=2777116 RepID=A0A8S1HB71_9PELO|nr:unnamed protein product [Caenorhabditis auriculariae]
MLRRNTYFLLALGAFTVVSIYLYTSIDSGNAVIQAQENDLKQLQQKIVNLQAVAKGNRATIIKLREELAELEKKPIKSDEEKLHKAPTKSDKELIAEPVIGNKVAHVNKVLTRTSPSYFSSTCDFRSNHSFVRSDLQMLDLYDLWQFENEDGGVWKQGWPITYDDQKVASEPKLQVIVLPHSHCDPGWIHTFEAYYEMQTRKILDGMAKHLGEKEGMKFIYAEMSFFELWWRDQNEETRNKVKSYIENGQFEVVTGGWVMTDEANSHYHSIIVELIEGHEWILNHLGPVARPKAHWSIDPFGLSPSIPHLLAAANITNAALQRIHYVVKRELARKKQLEFHWRQMFDAAGHSDIRAHVFPFYSYDVPHTCGPEPRICCQFDFRRLPAGGKSCDWNVPPQKINKDNVAERAHMIYDQYRKKSQLYKTNVLLVPLGDDFRYDVDFEWNEQYTNYKKLFEYMNQNSAWNVQVTLDEALVKSGERLPTLSGDFFTYADRDDHYWSGYFSSRPFYKQMDRVLQHWLRSAEIVFTLSSIEEEGAVDQKVFNRLILARRALSLFQHHDGVTGTAKDEVVVDYGNKMLEALKACEEVLSESLTILLGLDSAAPMKMDEIRQFQDLLPQRRVFSIDQNVVLFNALTRRRREVKCIHVDSIDAVVELAVKDQLAQQVNPVFETVDDQLVLKEGVYELCFQYSLGPLAAASYRIIKANQTLFARKAAIFASRTIATNEFDFKTLPNDFAVENDHIKATFDNAGSLMTVVQKDFGVEVGVNAHFVYYGARGLQKFRNGGTDYPSGAYLFLPDGKARRLATEDNSFIIVIEGPVVKQVVVAGNKDLKIQQTWSLQALQNFLDVDTEVDLRSKRNFELALRFNTTVKSGQDFFTDLNGLQMIRRKRQQKLPLQANYYPMPSSAFLEDADVRFSLFGSQALGVSSLESGQLEVLLDRRLSSDDGRGLFQGVLDNKRTVSHFRILVEPMKNGGYAQDERVGFHSHVGNFVSSSLLYPVVAMAATDAPSKMLQSTLVEDSLHCDFHLVTLRTLSDSTSYASPEPSTKSRRQAAMVVHRVIPDCRSKLKLADTECMAKPFKIVPSQLISLLKKTIDTSLTLLYEKEEIESFELNPQDVKTVKLVW